MSYPVAGSPSEQWGNDMSLPDSAKTWTTRHEDRQRWPDGPWHSEPDKISWTDPDTGRPCLIVRNGSGGLCGYAAVDPGHLLHGIAYNVGWYGDPTPESAAVDHIEVHGDLTYSGLCQETDEPSHGICHIPEPGQPEDVWWFGFDCLHSGDDFPNNLPYRDSDFMARYGIQDVYRDVDYVVEQCESLARQLVAADVR